jgi:hypothetical protein
MDHLLDINPIEKEKREKNKHNWFGIVLVELEIVHHLK